MAHTISKQIYCENERKYVECEVMLLDEEERLPQTDRREIILYCPSCGDTFDELAERFSSDINDLYPETELIDQYENFDNRD